MCGAWLSFKKRLFPLYKSFAIGYLFILIYMMKKFLIPLACLFLLTACGPMGTSTPNPSLPKDASVYAAEPLPDSHAELQASMPNCRLPSGISPMQPVKSMV